MQDNQAMTPSSHPQINSRSQNAISSRFKLEQTEAGKNDPKELQDNLESVRAENTEIQGLNQLVETKENENPGLEDSQAISSHSKSILSQNSGSFEGDKEPEDRSSIKLPIQAFVQSIFETVNNHRVVNGKSELFQDLGLMIMAGEYAFLEEESVFDQDKFDRVVKKNKYMGEIESLFVAYDFFEDENIDMEMIQGALKQCLSIFFVVPEETAILLKKNANCVGIGISFRGTRLCMCLSFSEVGLRLNKININAIGKLEIEGQLLLENYGVYILRISSLDDEDKFLITPQNISWDHDKNEFLVCVDYKCNLDSIEKVVEVFVKSEPSSIRYGVASNLKYIPKHYEPCYVFPLIKFPLNKVGNRKFSKIINTISPPITNQARKNASNTFPDDSNHSQSQLLDQRSITKKRSMASKDMSSVSDLENSENDHESSQMENSAIMPANKVMTSKFKKNMPHSICKYELGQQYEDGETPRTGEDALKRELEDALMEARKELQKQINRNKGLQTRVWYKLKSNKAREIKSAFINNEYNTNEIKYANSLALNTEIRNELKQIKDKYQQASKHIIAKFEEKKARFNDIKNTFMNLKREVCRNAIYETTMKKIPQRILDEVESKESEINDFCNNLRLEIITMRTDLEKNIKMLANKEELADGLHLIDFEKLKIENQSLSEKIEERNDEIYKLTNKNTINVHILAHIKEKLKWEQDKIQDLVSEFNTIGMLIRRRVPHLQEIAMFSGQRPQDTAEVDAQADSGDRNHQKQIPQTRFHQPQEGDRVTERRKG
jgi:hypothetical protein